MIPTPEPPTPATRPTRSRRRRRLKQGLLVLAAIVLAYVAVAYVAAPNFIRWRLPHPALEEAPKVTHTRNHVEGDPVNIALIGTEEELLKAFRAAGWHTADPITSTSALHMSQACALGRSYPTAPVSNLYLWGRRQDYAFQQAEGNTPKRRHHVRFWRSEAGDDKDRPLWLGAGTFDRRVGIDPHTLQFTHHIDGDVDAEREKVLTDLESAHCIIATYRIPWVGKEWTGYNGGHDRFQTDGDLVVGVLGEVASEQE